MIANVLMKKGLCYSTVKNVGIFTSENYVYKRRRMFGKVSRLSDSLIQRELCAYVRYLLDVCGFRTLRLKSPVTENSERCGLELSI